MAETRPRAGKPRLLKVGPATPEEVQRAARSRGVELAPTYYGTRIGQARALAFTVSGLASLEQLAAVKRSLDDAVAAGDSFTAWRRRVLRGEVPLSLPAHRLETVWRNNLMSAYARGNGAWQLDHKDSHPFLLYDAVNDSRTRPAHARMDGVIRPVGDPWWSSHYPPNGHNCRCRVIALTAEQAAEKGGVTVSLPDDAQPDAGWDYDPRVDPTAALRKAVTRARSTLPRQLAAKLKPLDDAIAAGPDLGLPPVRTWQDAVKLGREELDRLLASVGATRETIAEFARDYDSALKLRRLMLETLTARAVIGDAAKADVAFIRAARGPIYNKWSLERVKSVARESLPASWLRAAQADGVRLRVRATTGRAHYDGFNEDAGPVMLDPGTRGVALHEFAHYLQHKLPQLDELFQSYARYRTANSPLESLRVLTGNSRYSPVEFARPDALWNPYAGKWYPENRWTLDVPYGYLEMMPMLLQMLEDTHALQSLLTKGDLEALEMMLGTLQGWRP